MYLDLPVSRGGGADTRRSPPPFPPFPPHYPASLSFLGDPSILIKSVPFGGPASEQPVSTGRQRGPLPAYSPVFC